jgi:cyclophilin family peptidyl-prolyl cis-trans isomerase
MVSGAASPRVRAGYAIKDEFTRRNSNDRGTISMANARNIGGSQLLINQVDNNSLDKPIRSSAKWWMGWTWWRR